MKTKHFKLILILFVLLSTTLVYKPYEVKAISVIGSNAIKSAIIGSMEKGGINFTSKTAKEKAADAWNLKAYEKWKADEVAGKNADLWAAYETFTLNPPTPQPIPDKPGFGRILLDATIFGMAIGIGADIGYAIQDAQYNNNAMKYMASDIKNIPVNAYLNTYLNVTKTPTISGSDYATQYNIGNPPHGLIVTSYTKIENDPAMWMKINKIEEQYTGNFKLYYTVTAYRDRNGYVVTENGNTIVNKTVIENISNSTPIKTYDYEPLIDDVPSIQPNPHIEPLIAPDPDLAVIPELIPDKQIEVIVPLEPDVEPFWEGEINTPYEPTPGTDPGTEPGTDPGKEPEPVSKEEFTNTQTQNIKESSEGFVPMITNQFPFSLPWDFYHLFNLIAAEPKTPKWEIDTSNVAEGQYPIKFKIDLTFLDPYAPWFRAFILIGFAISVIFMHRSLVGGAK